MEVFLAFGNTYTTVSCGDLVHSDQSRMVQDESVTGRAQSLPVQSGLLEPVAHLLRAVLQLLAPALEDAIDLRGDLSHQNLVLAFVAKSKRGTDGEMTRSSAARGARQKRG